MMPLRELVETWASVYANSPAVRSGVTFAHVGALIVGGGSAVAADLGTVRALRRDDDTLQAEIARLHGTHRLVITSLVVIVTSGLLLMLTDFDAYVASTAFWIKLGTFAGLIANGAALSRMDATVFANDRRGRIRLRLTTFASLALWLSVTLLGTIVPNVL